MAGLRDTNDIDILVNNEAFKILKERGWQELDKGDGHLALQCEPFEAFLFWGGSPYNPTLSHLLKSANIIEGVPFASLEEVRKWKMAFGRDKDFIDIKLIDELN